MLFEELPFIIDNSNQIVMLVSVFPFLLNLKYYYQTKIIDYLLISLFFFYGSVVQFFNSWYLIGFYFGRNLIVSPLSAFNPDLLPLFLYFVIPFIFTLDALPLFIISIRAKYPWNWKEIPLRVYTILTIPLVLTVFAAIDRYGTRIFEDVPLSDSMRWALFLNRIIFHSFLVFTFMTSEYEKTNRSDRSRSFWILGSIAIVVANILISVPSFILGMNIGGLLFLIFSIFATLGYILYLVNHIFYPEAVLFTHEQVLRSYPIYKKLKLNRNILHDLGLGQIMEYLREVSQDMADDHT